jgi:hypothetical protein
MGIAFGYQHVKLNYHYVRIKQIEWNAIKEAKALLRSVFYGPALHNFYSSKNHTRHISHDIFITLNL